MQNIYPGTILYSDSWKGYNTNDLVANGYYHLTVNHLENFINPIPGVNTQMVESMWCHAKARNKRHKGTARSQLNSYFAEFMWRRSLPHGADDFDEILKEIVKLAPPS